MPGFRLSGSPAKDSVTASFALARLTFLSALSALHQTQRRVLPNAAHEVHHAGVDVRVAVGGADGVVVCSAAVDAATSGYSSPCSG